MDNREYGKFISNCNRELTEKQETIADLQLFGASPSLHEGKIRFSDESEVCIEVSVVSIGSFGRKSSSWQWAWSNQSLPETLRPPRQPFERLASHTGNRKFIEKMAFKVGVEEYKGLISAACREMTGHGVYQLFAEGFDWIFLIKQIKRLKSEQYLFSRAQSLATQTLLSGMPAILFNNLRARFRDLRPNLSGVDFRGARAPWSNDLHTQILFDFNYMQTHAIRDLSGVNLSNLRLDGAIFRGVNLSGASLEGSVLVGADMSGADLRGASLRDAFLNGANFTRAQVEGADFSGAQLSSTLLTNLDLSKVVGLEEATFTAPSEISLSTLIASKFAISTEVLRKAGVSRGLLDDLIKGQRFENVYQTCFLSYSTADRPFAEKLYNSLQEVGIRVFWDRFDVLPGESLDDQIRAAIMEHNRVVVVLSPQSMRSRWVKREIELAWSIRADSLLPIRICPVEDIRRWVKKDNVKPNIAELFAVLDFSEWQNSSEYDHALDMLQKSLATGVRHGV